MFKLKHKVKFVQSPIGITAWIPLVRWPDGLLISAGLIFVGYLCLLLAQAVDRPSRDVRTLDLDTEISLEVDYPINLRLGEPQPIKFSLQRGLTSTMFITYTVAVSASKDVVALSDQDGNPIAVEQALAPGSDASAWTLYLLQREEVSRDTNVTVAVQVKELVSKSEKFQVQTDTPLRTAWRRVRQVLASPVAPFASIAGLAIPWLREEQQRREKRRQALEQEIARIRDLPVQRQLEEYLQQVHLRPQEKTTLWMGIRSLGWEEIALKHILEILDQQKELDEARRWLDLVKEKSPDHNLLPVVNRLVEEANQKG